MENWHVNDFWNDSDGNPTQWVHNELPLYIDLIEGKYEVNYKFNRVYQTNTLDGAMKFAERNFKLDEEREEDGN